MQKTFHKVQQAFLIETPSKLVIEGHFLTRTRIATYKKPAANIVYNGEKLNAFLLPDIRIKDISSYFWSVLS